VFSVLGLMGSVVLVGLVQPVGWRSEAAAALELFERVNTSGGHADWAQVPSLVVVGLIAGVLAGMLGMAGGVLQLAGMLVVFKMDILLARAVSLTTMLLATVSAARVHIKNGVVLKRLVRPMLLPSIVGVVLGVVVGNVVPRLTLSHFFALFALFLSFGTLAQCLVDPHEHVLSSGFPDELAPGAQVTASGIGGVHGFTCGLLGISGGVVALSLQQVLLSVPVRNAVANTVTISAVVTAVGSIVAVTSGVWRQDFTLDEVAFVTLWIGGAALLGAPLGAQLTGKVRAVYLKLMFVNLSLAAGLLVLFK
jgi:uncharacterized membrane protein YfcA